jgi:hypothetical protein
MQGRRVGAVEVQNAGCTALRIDQDTLGAWVTILPWTPLTPAGLGPRDADESLAAWRRRAADEGGLELSHRFCTELLLRGGLQRDPVMRLRVVARAPELPGVRREAQTLAVVRLVEATTPV